MARGANIIRAELGVAQREIRAADPLLQIGRTQIGAGSLTTGNRR